MAWPAFHCDEPDFFVRSIRDDPPVKFGVLRNALSGSEIFRDMFDCCEEGSTLDEVLDLDEPADTLNILMSLLHTPPPAPEQILDPNAEKYSTTIKPKEYEAGSVIPFPLLPRMLQLADKYALPESLQRSLLAHLASYVSAYPLKVYGYATEHGLRPLAIEASEHLLHPPLSFYSPDDLRVIPVPEAWHELVLLHEVRIRGLRSILLAEEIFPHGYGACASHKERTPMLWKQRKYDIVLRIEAATDVAAEMASLQQEFVSCKTCQIACTAAVSMLAYKCQKLPKSTYGIHREKTGEQWLSYVLGKFAN